MNDSRPERDFRGVCASQGLVIGPLVRVSPVLKDTKRHRQRPDQEWERLKSALQTARRELTALAENEDSQVAEILEFQVEMLGDEELAQESLERIGAGMSAAEAWWACLEAHIEGYRGEEDEYFRARSADLIDLRDRVAVLLGVLDARGVDAPAGAILLDEDFTPTRFLGLDCDAVGGIALTQGSTTSHVAMLARARGVPMVTGLGDAETEGPRETSAAILDAKDGVLITDPGESTLGRYTQRFNEWRRQEAEARQALTRPAVTLDGNTVTVMVNVDHPGAITDELLSASDGVGLMRTEFLYMGDRQPDEETQYRTYVELLDRCNGKPCVIRTLDIGGDKPVRGFTVPLETNPFLGLRGIRLTLETPELFRPQVRALLRAAAGRSFLKVMLPMVATPSEYDEAKAFFRQELANLTADGFAAEMPPLGIMVETPASAIAVDTFDAAFYSIGSNDLTQYVMAASRDGVGRVAALNDPAQPAVLRLIEAVLRHGREVRRPVSLCGDMGSDPGMIGTLLNLGLDCLSVAPAALGHVKLAIQRFRGDRENRTQTHA